MSAINFTIDGKKVSCKKGEVVLQAGLDAGIFIPHYCYHPALSIAGNCRMCLVEIVPKPPPNAPPGWKPPPQKPAIACATEVTEGMEVVTTSKMVKEAREGVLEFLLVNHPLDCPVCDQAGECGLQDFSFQYGQSKARFVEKKNVKHAKDFGPEVRLYGNRCIVCTRCVRFSHEVTGTGEICVAERGDRSVVDVVPGFTLDNPLSGNVVDICPVGALVSRDFLHKTRVWHLDETDSVCPHCSTGCSISIHTQDETIMRLKPRPNPAVNGYWMCDAGRLGYKFVHEKKRLTKHEAAAPGAAAANGTLPREPVSFHAAIAALAKAIEDTKAKHGGAAIAGIATAWLTNEELFLFRALMRDVVGTEKVGLIARGPWKEQRFRGTRVEADRNPNAPGQRPDRGSLYPDGSTFVIEADRNPNRSGAEAILGAEACGQERLESLCAACMSGEIKLLLLFSGIPEVDPPQGFLDAIFKVPYLAVVDFLAGPEAARAHLLLAGATFAEKEGTYTNGRGHVQRLHFARATPGQARPEIELLHTLLAKMGKRTGAFSPAATFAEIAASVPAFRGLTWKDLHPRGLPMVRGDAAAAAPAPVAAKEASK